MGSHVGELVEISWIAIAANERAANIPERLTTPWIR